jgi:multicomponent Na+:H+ antiporter subunit E
MHDQTLSDCGMIISKLVLKRGLEQATETIRDSRQQFVTMSVSHREQNTGHAHGPLSWLRRLVLFALLWWILTGGSPDGWIIGIPVIILASWLSLILWSHRSLSLIGIARFMPWFLWQSLIGATDVAIRSFKPEMPLRPGLVRQRLRLPPGACRVMLANVVSMLAGTLSANLEDDDLVIHALDLRKDMEAMVRDLEPRIADIFALELDDESVRETA